MLKIFDNPDQWLKENMQYIKSDNVAPVFPIDSWIYGETSLYYDQEEGIEKECTWPDHIKALELLADQVGRVHPDTGKELYLDAIRHPCDLLDAGNWDNIVSDTYWQLVFYGRVIYG